VHDEVDAIQNLQLSTIDREVNVQVLDLD